MKIRETEIVCNNGVVEMYEEYTDDIENVYLRQPVVLARNFSYPGWRNFHINIQKISK